MRSPLECVGKSFRPFACLLIIGSLAVSAYLSRAASVFWTNFSGGLYSDPVNWSPNVLPGTADTISFTNAAAYSFTVDVAATNSAALFNRGSLTQAITGTSWALNEWRIGETPGSTARVAFVAGQLMVTNDTQTGRISVGRFAQSEFAILGGEVTTDFLDAANGTNTILAFGSGSLTTLKGCTVNKADGLGVGTTAGSVFTWNVLGGTNQITTPVYYGGLGLGGNGKARLNITGSNSVFNVHGLDTAGGNEIYVSRGAKFQTHSVQLGLGSSPSNVVVITDPGSSWINDYLIYFGMHAGAQTMIISNGGYFKSGGTTYGDMRVNTFDQPNSRIVITGSNSWFHSDGTATFGQGWSSPVTSLNCLLLVTNGGKFSARQLTYGSTAINLGSVSRPGNVIDVADGSMWIGSLNFAVGTLRINASTGVVDQLSLVGGTNAILVTAGTLYVGHHGPLSSGDLKVGAANSVLASASGDLQLGGWNLGAGTGDVGSVTLIGGRVSVTNASGTSALIVGGGGAGTLISSNVPIQADVLRVSDTPGSSGVIVVNGTGASLACSNIFVGGGGSIIATNGATLKLNTCDAPAGKVLLSNSSLEFIGTSPSLSDGAIVATNITVIFRNSQDAGIGLSDMNFLGKAHLAGTKILKVFHTIGASSDPFVIDTNDAAAWSQLAIAEGTSALQAASFMVGNNAILSATDADVTFTGPFTNRGRVVVTNSTLRFSDTVMLSSSSPFQGIKGYLVFAGGLHLPAYDVVVPSGLAVQASWISSDGGKLILSGNVIPNADGSVPSQIVSQTGWITYLDHRSAPLTPPSSVPNAHGLELLRSTNAPTAAFLFAGGAGRFDALRLSKGSAWYSDSLTVGNGAAMFFSDSSAKVILSTGPFRVEQGGLFTDETGGTNHVGFSSASFGAVADVSGTNSTWIAPNGLSIGMNGSQNQMQVRSGGSLFAKAITVGGPSTVGNKLLLTDGGTFCYATNGIAVGGSDNQVLVQTGSVLVGSQITTGGTNLLVSISDSAVSQVTTQLVLSGSRVKLEVTNGGALFTSNATLNTFPGSIDIAGEKSVWNVRGTLTLNIPSSPTSTNTLMIRDRGVVSAGLLIVPGSSLTRRAVLTIQGGMLFVTNASATSVLSLSQQLLLNRGLLQVDKLVVTSGGAATLNINAGTARWAASDIPSGVVLQVGNGTNSATLSLLGGTNLVRSGMVVGRFSQLTGSGQIFGFVTNRGMISPDSIAIQNDLVSEPLSRMQASISASPGSPQNSLLVVTGNVSIAGNLLISIAPGFTPSSAHSFVVIRYGSKTGNFANVNFGDRLLTSDRLASFRIDDTGNAIVATDFRSEDLDGDGIQDSWAIQQFGVTPLSPGTGPNNLDGDWDGDGLSNRDEFRIGTVPLDSVSSIRVRLEVVGPVSARLHIPAIDNRNCLLQASDDLISWIDVPTEQYTFSLDGSAVWSDTQANRRFYRLIVQ